MVHLSLRYCAITSLGAKYLGESLGSATRQNTRLMSLDLAGNHISDTGVSYLADGLRLNRTLLVLNLAANGIGDTGAMQLATVLSTFELSHDEVVQRRRLHYARRQRAPSTLLRASKLGIKRVSSTQSQRSRKRGVSPTERSDHGKTLKPTARTGKSSKQTQLDVDGKPKKDKSAAKAKKSGLFGRGVESSESLHSVDQSLPSDSRNPLLSVVVLRESTAERPTTLVRGNRSLISLNLSRNNIGLAGMTALLDAVLPLSRDPIPADPAMPGLLRLTTHNNRASGPVAGLSRAGRSTSETDRIEATARYLQAAMATLNPLLRTHTVTTATTSKLGLSSTYINVIDA